jgi:hypothetical protein
MAANVLTAAATALDFGAEIADAVWDEVMSGHLTGGSTGAALNAAGSAGDPWTTTLPGAYTGSQAGKMLADILTDTAEIGAAGAGLTALAPATNLTTLTNYVDTEVATIVTQTTAASIRTALGLVSANLDSQLGTISTKTNNLTFTGDDVHTVVHVMVANVISAGTISPDAIGADEISAAAVTKIQAGLSTLTASQVWDLADGIETGLTPRQAMRIDTAALCGKISGAGGNTATFRNVGDTKNRIVATVDIDGNRTAVTTDAT